jgi:hypothetical protein
VEPLQPQRLTLRAQVQIASSLNAAGASRISGRIPPCLIAFPTVCYPLLNQPRPEVSHPIRWYVIGGNGLACELVGGA